MKKCNNCGKDLGFFSFFSKAKCCQECDNKLKQELLDIQKQIIDNKSVQEGQIATLMKYDKNELLAMYSNIYEELIKDKELEEEEIEALSKLQLGLNLSNEEINYEDKVRPYIYVNEIRKEGKLPVASLEIADLEGPILKKSEVVHFAVNALLKEIRAISLGYSGGSHGVSIRIAKGISYRVGAHRGQLVKEDRLVPVSQGILIVTNQRLLLHPLPGNKLVNIPLDKILSYHCYENGIEIFKEGREKSYFFEIEKKGPVEIFGICLGSLLRANQA